MKKIAICGGYGLSNFGDDLLMIGAYNFVKKYFKQYDISIVYWDLDYIKRFCKDSVSLSIKDIKNDRFNLLIVGGGTQYYSFGKSSFLDKNFIKGVIKFILFNTINQKKITSFGLSINKMFLLGIGFGPFENIGFNYLRTKSIIKKADYISVRDLMSVEFLKKNGIKSTLGADICYSALMNSYFKKKNGGNIGIKKIGVVVRDWPYDDEEAIRLSIMTLCKYIGEKNIEVSFVVFAPHTDKRWMNFFDKNRINYVTWHPDSMIIADFMEIVRSFDLIITMRYHGAVIASLLNIPILCVNIEQKLKIISDQIGKGSYCWDWKNSTKEAEDYIDYVNNNYIDIVSEIENNVTRQKKLANKMISNFFEVIRRNIDLTN